MRRALFTADIAALAAAYATSRLVNAGISGDGLPLGLSTLALTMLIWTIAAKLHGLYERDEEHVDHSTVDEFVGVLQLLTLVVWCKFIMIWIFKLGAPDAARLLTFWIAAIVLVTLARGLARAVVRQGPSYLQNTIIIGAGHIGQLAARKLLQHPEYGINIVGFVDEHPRERRLELGHIALLGSRDQLPEVIETLDVERVIIAFSEASHEELLQTIRDLRKLGVQIDVVPRLFEIVGPKAGIHMFEGLALVGLPPAKLSPSSRLLKRGLDWVVALPMLIVTLPLMAIIALCIRLESKGPALFRQRRLGYDMRPFTVLKFRTMQLDTDQEEHRQYIERTKTSAASPNSNGLYKLDRTASVTRVGRILRKTSLDELPQLFNILAGEMSLVGPRPCLDYETGAFEEHHYERFLMPPGLTGLWQVTARARSTFGEALDMDVSYVRGWSFALDVQLLIKTPFSLFRLRATS